MEKTQRQQRLLKAIVDEYIKTAHPVGSKTLVEEHGFDFSPATIRNDMAELEEGGYIVQPHTSAGRIPTEKGYQFYIAHFVQAQPELKLNQRKRVALDDAVRDVEADAPDGLRHLAKVVADMTDETVVMTVGDTVYYTGIAHMLRKPEFTQQAEMMAAIGEVFDRLDEVMTDMQHQLTHAHDGVQVLIGRNNPFSHNCSMIMSDYGSGVFGILGPMRMDYETNIAIAEYMEELINHHHDEQTTTKR